MSTRQSDQLRGYHRTGLSGQTKGSRRPNRPAFGKAPNQVEEAASINIVSDHPVDLLREEGFRALEPHIPIYEGDFSNGETEAIIRYYESIGYMDLHSLVQNKSGRDAVKDKFHYKMALNEFKMMCDNNPGEVFKQAAMY